MLMLNFKVGNDCYNCSCDWIAEIVPRVPLVQVPQTSPHVAGLLNYGGDSILILDFTSVLLGRLSHNLMNTKIIIFKRPLEENHIQTFGLVVEEVLGVEELNPEVFKKTGLEIKKPYFLDGIYNTQNTNKQLVRVDLLFEALPKLLE